MDFQARSTLIEFKQYLHSTYRGVKDVDSQMHMT